jgi:hypothetical protein
MAGLDPTIPLSIKPPDVPGSMAQWGQLGVLRNQLQLGNNQVQLSNATLQPSIDQARAQASTAVSQAGAAAQMLSQQELATMRAYLSNAIQVGAAIAKDPSVAGPEATGASAQATLTRAIADILANSGAPTSAYAQAFAGLPDRTKGAQPQDYVRWIAGKLAAATDAAAQLDRQFPPAQMVNNNQTIQQQAAGGMVAQTPPGTPMGMPTQLQLPPTQPVMRGNVPGVLGANPAPGFVQTAPALGQAAAVQGTVESNVKHFADVQTAAAAAPTCWAEPSASARPLGSRMTTTEPLPRNEKVTFTYARPSVALFEGLRIAQPLYATGGVPTTNLAAEKAPPSSNRTPIPG